MSVKRIVVLLLFLTGLGLALMTRPVDADNGPHGGYTATTDACAGCHRAHTAGANKLLVTASPELCYTCHGVTSGGAQTNVKDGVLIDGTNNRALKGGGFVNALMDTNWDGIASSIGVSSTHIADGGLGIAWGNGAILTDTVNPGLLNFSLSCLACHDPHGRAGSTHNETYRILRAIPLGSGATTGIDITDEITKTYTVYSTTNNYIGEPYGALGSPLEAWCSQCHTRYHAESGSGHTDSADPIFRYRHTTTSVSCVKCHVAHGTSASMVLYSGAVKWPNNATTPSGNARSSLLRLDNRGVCAYCHVSNGRVTGGACDSCHGAPPNTGAHAKHSGSAGAGYGLTGSFATATAYQYGCGECHPTDPSKHMDGTAQVQIASTGAPALSLKSRHASTGAFAGGTCTGAYCHSGIQVTSGAVPLPQTDGTGNPLLDARGNYIYDPYTVTETPIYRTTPAWAGGSLTTCAACHAFPLATAFPAVQAGVGQSHQWIDDYGYGNLHAYNMSFNPLVCRTCHYGEITQANTWTRDGMGIVTYNSVPLASKANHANGFRNVTFDPINPVVYGSSFSLAGAIYQASDKSCTNVACHLNQTYVQWGKPYRWWTSECNLCHQY